MIEINCTMECNSYEEVVFFKCSIFMLTRYNFNNEEIDLKQDIYIIQSKQIFFLLSLNI